MEEKSNLARRALAAAVFGPILLILFWFGGLFLIIGICFIVSAGTWEYFKMQEIKGLQPWSGPGVAASFIWCASVGLQGTASIPFLLIGLILLVFCFGLTTAENRLNRIQSTLTGVLYVAGLASVSLLVRQFSYAHWTPTDSAYCAILILLGIWVSDILSYFSGLWFGKRHPFPGISPGKTWAGFTGGLLGAIACICGGAIYWNLLSPWQSLGLGWVVGIGSPLGDLVESMIKRDAGVKDASGLIPGHGGILDRFDSFLFVYPLAFFYLLVLRSYPWF